MTKTKLFTTLLIFTTFLFTGAYAQNGALTISVIDGDINKVPIIGATIEIIPVDNEGMGVYYSTDMSGKANIPAISYGTYTIKVSYIGYDTSITEATINSPSTQLPDIVMISAPIKMDAVVMNASLRASQSGDSLRYNASAYKVTADADVEGLLQKMPGMSIEDGKLSAQGEEIKKIYIDGKEFFGDDVTVALKSLPAEVVDKIELYDKQSDESESSGMDDGNSSKSINIVTKPNMREGVFGKVFVGGGIEPEPREDGDRAKYLSGGSVNIFSEQRRITIIGLANNLNQQNFSFEDIMGVEDEDSRNTGNFMVKALPGFAKVNAIGVNYSEDFGKDDKVKVQGSYFFNKTTTTDNETLKRWYEEPATDNIDSLYQDTFSITENLNNRLNARINIKLSNTQSLTIVPALSFQSTDPYKSYSGYRYEDSKYSANDGVQEYANTRNSVWDGFNLSTSTYYSLRFKSRRSISIGGSIKINSYDSSSETVSEPNIPSTATENTYKFETAPNYKRILSANFSYMEPINKRLSLNLAYKVSQTYQESDKNTYQTDETFSLTNEDASLLTTNYAESDYLKQSISPGIRYYKGKTRLSASVLFQHSTLYSNTTTVKTSSDYDSTQKNNNDYQNITYSVVGNIFFNKENTLRIFLNSDTNPPPIARFLDNTSSTSYITSGNPDLKPTYTNRLNMRYIHTNLEKGSTFMVMLNAYTSKNYIASHIVLNPEPFYNGNDLYEDVSQYTTWVNIDNYWSFSSNLSYGFPLNAIKCNVNLSGGFGYTITPSIYGGTVVEMGVIEGGDKNSTEKMSYRAGVNIGSNISENVDFTLSWYGDYNDAINDTATSESLRVKNRYLNQTASLAMKVVFLGGFTFTGNVIYKQYQGLTNNYNDNYLLCNAFIGRKILHKKRGEINIGVNDILNQNTNFSRSIGSTYTQNITHSTLGRYYSAQFIYNLRFFPGNR